MRPLVCPVCEKSVAPRGENPFFPFCSRRCRLVDLGRWFGEQYRVPGDPAEDEDAPPPRDRDDDQEPSG